MKLNILRRLLPGMKNFGKGMGVLLVAALAIGINIVGFQRVKGNQHAQKVEQVATTIISQQKQLADLQKIVATAYTNEEKIFLKPTLTSEDVNKMEASITRLRVSAEDFGIQAKDLPAEAKDIAQKKANLQAQVQRIADQAKLQSEVSRLFINETINWENVENDVIIGPKVTEQQISEVSQKVQKFEQTAWQANLIEYLSFAEAQVKRIEDLRTAFTEMLVDGNITEAATYDRYYSVSESLSQVRNPDVKAELLEQLNTISQQLGMGSVY